MTPHQDDAQMRGDRPGRLDVRRPYLFTFLIVIMIMVVTGASGAGAAVSGLPTSDFELGAEVVLAVLAAVGLTRLHSWRDVGFRPLARARDLRLYWVPLFPVLPVLAPAVSGLTRIGLGQLGVYLALAGLIGFVEEVFFRGLILRSLAARGALRAAIVSSVLFGLMHSVNVLFGADPAATLLQAGYATAMGFSFATVTLRTGVIWPLIIIHGSINAAGFVTAGGTISTGVTSADVMVSAIYIVGFTIYGVIVLQTAQRPIARPTADEGALSRSSDPR